MTSQLTIATKKIKPLALAIKLACSAVLVLSANIMAQQIEANSQADNAQTSNVQAYNAQKLSKIYNITTSPLAKCLNRFAEQSGINLSANAKLTQGKTCAGIKGALSIENALLELLKYTDLKAIKQNDGSYLLVTIDVTNVLATATVTNVEENATSPVQGYVAKRSTTGTKTDTALIETSQSISVVTAQNIANRKVNSVEDAVAYTAGVRTGDSGLDPRFDQIIIRGLAATTTADFLDGLRQPNTGWLSYFVTESYNLERIEVLKGPSSVLYGQVNPGGMVNRVSKRPAGTEQGEVQLQVGNYGYIQGQFDFTGNIDDTLSYRVVGLKRDADTEVVGVNNDATFIAPSLTWNISEQTSLTVLSQYQDRETSGSPRPYQDSDGLTTFWVGDEDFDKLDQQQFTLGYEFSHRFNDNVSLQHNLRYGDVDTINQYVDGYDSGDGNTLNRDSYGVYEGMETISSDTRFIFDFSTGDIKHTLLTGIDYATINYDVEYTYGLAPSIDIDSPDYSQVISRPDMDIVTLSGESDRIGIYLIDQMEIGNWRLSAGLRHDSVDDAEQDLLYGDNTDTDENDVTGQFGALYLFDSGWAPYVSYAQSFLPQIGSDINGNEFSSTEGEQFELGAKYQPNNAPLLFTASLYQITQSNLLTTDLANIGFSKQTGEQQNQGVELEMIADFTNQLSLTVAYNYNDAEATKSNDGNEGKELSNSPRHLASIWSDYKFDNGTLAGLSISGGVRWVGSSYDDALNTTKNDDYTLADIGISYMLQSNMSGITLGLNVSNLFDERYINCVDTYCYRGAARKVVGSVSYRW
jgi:iron complex outermembrane receptor protein